jgi:hypothetical protein
MDDASGAPAPPVARADAFRLLAQPWSEWPSYVQAWSRASLQWMSIFCDPAPLRRQWLAALSQMTDRYLRSPAALELAHRNLRAMTALARHAPIARPRQEPRP